MTDPLAYTGGGGTYPTIAGALTAWLTGKPTLPTSRTAIIATLDDLSKKQRASVLKDAAADLGVSLRAVQRYTKAGGGEIRSMPARFVRWFTDRLSATKMRQGRRSGARIRIAADIQVSRVCRHHTMPADVAAKPAYVGLDANLMGPVLDSWQDGDIDQAADELLARFFVAYGLSANTSLCGDGIAWAEIR